MMTMTAAMTAQSLQDEFDNNVREMKPYVLALKLKSERQKCAHWIRKLCEIPQGLTARKIRNSYSKVILNMLKRGKLESPFSVMPHSGALTPLPIYLIQYIQEPITSDVPVWVADLSHGDVRTCEYEAADDEVEEDAYDPAAAACHAELPLPPPPTRSPSKSPSRSPPIVRNVSYRAATPEIRSTPNEAGSARRGLQPYDQSSGTCSEEIEAEGAELVASSHALGSNPTSPRRQPQYRRSAPTAGSYANGSEKNGLSQGSSSDSVGEAAIFPWRREAALQFLSDEAHKELGLTELRRSALSPVSKGGSPSYAVGRSPPPPPVQELDVKLKAFEARLRDETMQLHRKHDSAIQKVLHKKNSELDEVKNRFQSKVREQEDTIARLEKKVQTIVKDSALVRESKDQQIAELRKLADGSMATRQNDADRQLHDLVAEHERDKFELQKQHTRNIHDLTAETSLRLAKMESAHKRQEDAADESLREMEMQMKQTAAAMDKLTSTKNVLDQQNQELTMRLEEIQALANGYKSKLEALSVEHTRTIDDSRRANELAREKYEGQLNNLRRDHATALNRANEIIAELELRVTSLRQAASDAETESQLRAGEQEQARKQEIANAERRHEQKVRTIQTASEQRDLEHTTTLHSLEEQIRDKDAALHQQTEQLRQQAAQTERTIVELRGQADKRLEQAQTQGKFRLAQTEENLQNLKVQHDEQLKELQEQLIHFRKEHDKELSSLRTLHEQEKQQTHERERQQRESLCSTHSQEVEQLTASADADKAHLGEILRVTQEEYNRHAAELSDEIAALRDEMAMNEQLRRQQMAENRLMHDDERQRQVRDHDRDISRLKTDTERQRHEIQRAHTAEIDSLLANHDTKIKQLENDYTTRLTKAAETAQELRAMVEQMKSERRECAERMEAKLSECATRCEEEKRAMRQHTSAAVVALQEDVESQRGLLRQSERRMREAEADNEEKLLRATLDYENKMKGLMPASARQQLEDTIGSLKSQVATLKQRVSLLQEEQLEMKRPAAGRRSFTEEASAENGRRSRSELGRDGTGVIERSLNGSVDAHI